MKWVPAFLALVACPAMVSAQDAKTRILLIGKDPDHPPGTHEYMAGCRLLAACLEQTPGVKATVSNGWPGDSKAFEDLKAIALYTRNGGDVLLDPAHREQADALVAKGVGLAAIHWSTGTSDVEAGETWLKLLGGWFHTSFSNHLVRESVLRRAVPDHPVCRGWEDVPIREEFYTGLKFLPGIVPVMTAEIDGEVFPMGWAYERPGGGRSFGTVAGHFHENFGIEPFRRGIVNGILWVSGVEVPEGGAPCDVTPELPGRK